jgi:hypothetical protein
VGGHGGVNIFLCRETTAKKKLPFMGSVAFIQSPPALFTFSQKTAKRN